MSIKALEVVVGYSFPRGQGGGRGMYPGTRVGWSGPAAFSVGRQMRWWGRCHLRCHRIWCVEDQCQPVCGALPAHAGRRLERSWSWSDGGL